LSPKKTKRFKNKKNRVSFVLLLIGNKSQRLENKQNCSCVKSLNFCLSNDLISLIFNGPKKKKKKTFGTDFFLQMMDGVLSIFRSSTVH
jgi:hypothetical protein